MIVDRVIRAFVIVVLLALVVACGAVDEWLRFQFWKWLGLL